MHEEDDKEDVDDATRLRLLIDAVIDRCPGQLELPPSREGRLAAVAPLVAIKGHAGNSPL